MRLKRRVLGLYYNLLLGLLFPGIIHCFRQFSKEDIINYREEVREMFQHAYNGYLTHASGYDELRPLTCDGVNTWGSYSLTMIDALDTLAVMGNFSEFRRVVKILTERSNFDSDINVSVFETNIRIVGGLLSAHLLSYTAGVELEPGWPCNGPLLRLAEDVARRLLPAFDTNTGMPYGTVNLKYGVPAGETPITCTAGVGTFIVEFGALSRLTGDPIYEEVALNAIYTLWSYRSPIGLLGNHIDVQTGRWTAQDAGIGAGVDSFYEYLVKGAMMLDNPDLLEIFHEGRKAIDKYIRKDDWHVWVSMNKGHVTLPVFQSLEAFWPGILSLIGDIMPAKRTILNYYSVWKKYGFLPEFYNIPTGEASPNRESYPLRPEFIESVMYLYRATEDPIFLEMGENFLSSIQHSARTPCGYATIKNVRDHSLENRMESFFLAETTKYLYLLFDQDNFIHNDGREGVLFTTPNGQCLINAGGFIFNTEAHPIDPSALSCCYDLPRRNEMLSNFDEDEFLSEIYKIKEPKEFKYDCTEKLSKIEIPEIVIDLNAVVDSYVVAQKITKEIKENFDKMQSKNVNFNDINSDRTKVITAEKVTYKDVNNGFLELSYLWEVLEAVMEKNLKDPDGFKNFKEREIEIIELIKSLMKNIFVQAPTETTYSKPKSFDESSKLKHKTLFETYQSEERVKLALEVIEKVEDYQKKRILEYSTIDLDSLLGYVLGILSATKEDITNIKNSTHADILHILLKAQKKYEINFQSSLNMFKFLSNVKENYLLNKNSLKKIVTFLEKAEGISSKQEIVGVTAELDVDIFESLNKAITLRKRMREFLKRVEALEKEQRNESEVLQLKNEQKVASEVKNEEVANLVAASENKQADIHSKIDLSNNDDIIVVEKHLKSYKSDDSYNIGIGTAEPVDANIIQKGNIENEILETTTVAGHIKRESSIRTEHLSTDDNNFSVFTKFVKSVIESTFPSKPKFDPQLLLKKIRAKGQYLKHSKKYELFTCKKQPFLHKFSVWGEVF